MNPRDERLLLGGYPTNTLTRDEREALMLAASQDDELFAALVEADDLREALSDDAFRHELIRNLRVASPETEQSLWGRLRHFVSRALGARGGVGDPAAGWQPAPRWRFGWPAVASAALAIVAIVLIRIGTISETSPVARIALGPGTIPALHAAGILEGPSPSESRLESQSRQAPPADGKGSATLALDRSGAIPEYRIGDRLRIGFSVASPANALLIEERPDGSTVRLFPNRFTSSPGVAKGVTTLVPPAGQGDFEVEGPAGRRTLRLLIFPASVDPLASELDWESVRAQARVVERPYEIR